MAHRESAPELRFVTPEYNQQLRDLALLLCTQVTEYHPSPICVEDTRIGFDQDGNFHNIRTTGQNRWDSLGAYTVDL